MPTAGVADRVVGVLFALGSLKGAVLESPCREGKTLVFCVRLLRLDYPLLACIHLLYSCDSDSTDSLVYVATSEVFAAF